MIHREANPFHRFMRNLTATRPMSWRRGAIEQGMPEVVAGQLVTLFGFLRQDAHKQAADVVRTRTGRGPSPGSTASKPDSSSTRRSRRRDEQEERWP